MNEKRNESSERCRQANFSVLISNRVGVKARFFFLTALSILVRIIPGATFFNSHAAFNTLLLVLLLKSRMISLYRDIHWEFLKIDLYWDKVKVTLIGILLQFTTQIPSRWWIVFVMDRRYSFLLCQGNWQRKCAIPWSGVEFVYTANIKTKVFV